MRVRCRPPGLVGGVPITGQVQYPQILRARPASGPLCLPLVKPIVAPRSFCSYPRLDFEVVASGGGDALHDAAVPSIPGARFSKNELFVS